MLLVLFNLGYVKAQSVDSLTRGQCEIFNNWEADISFNSPEPLSVAGFDYNGLTQRIFTNGHRKEYSIDVGIGITRKLKGSLWLTTSVNYGFYKALETRDFREFYPPLSEYGLDTLTINQTTFDFSPGIFKRLNYSRIQLDLGLYFHFKYYSVIRGITSYSTYDSNNIFIGKVIYDQTQPGGWAMGAGPSLRIKYNIFRKLTIGIRFGTYLNYYATGGAITTYKTNIYSWGGSETGLSGVSQQTFQGLRFTPVFVNIQIAYRICNQ